MTTYSRPGSISCRLVPGMSGIVRFPLRARTQTRVPRVHESARYVEGPVSTSAPLATRSSAETTSSMGAVVTIS